MNLAVLGLGGLQERKGLSYFGRPRSASTSGLFHLFLPAGSPQIFLPLSYICCKAFTRKGIPDLGIKESPIQHTPQLI